MRGGAGGGAPLADCIMHACAHTCMCTALRGSGSWGAAGRSCAVRVLDWEPGRRPTARPARCTAAGPPLLARRCTLQLHVPHPPTHPQHAASNARRAGTCRCLPGFALLLHKHVLSALRGMLSTPPLSRMCQTLPPFLTRTHMLCCIQRCAFPAVALTPPLYSPCVPFSALCALPSRLCVRGD